MERPPPTLFESPPAYSACLCVSVFLWRSSSTREIHKKTRFSPLCAGPHITPETRGPARDQQLSTWVHTAHFNAARQGYRFGGPRRSGRCPANARKRVKAAFWARGTSNGSNRVGQGSWPGLAAVQAGTLRPAPLGRSSASSPTYGPARLWPAAVACSTEVNAGWLAAAICDTNPGPAGTWPRSFSLNRVGRGQL